MRQRRTTAGLATTRAIRVRRRPGAALVAALAIALTSLAPITVQGVTAPAAAASDCGADGFCTVTVHANDYATHAELADYTFIVNEDNTKRPSDPLSLNTES